MRIEYVGIGFYSGDELWKGQIVNNKSGLHEVSGSSRWEVIERLLKLALG